MTTYHLCLYVAHTRVALASCSRGIYGVKHIIIHAIHSLVPVASPIHQQLFQQSDSFCLILFILEFSTANIQISEKKTKTFIEFYFILDVSHLFLWHQIVSKYASSFGYSVHRNSTISIIMLIYSNNWPLQEQSYKIFPIFALTKTNRPMYTKTESKNEKMTTNQKKVESSVKKPMPSIWYT